MKRATLKELGIDKIPCSFDIKYVAADNTEDLGLCWYCYAQEPMYDPDGKDWSLSLDGCGSYYELGFDQNDSDTPEIFRGLTSENSLFEVIQDNQSTEDTREEKMARLKSVSDEMTEHEEDLSLLEDEFNKLCEELGVDGVYAD